MVGLLVVTHAKLAQELLSATEMILGPVPQARAVSVSRSDSVDAVSRMLKQACDELSQACDGLIIMTDMFGGTPTNLSLSLMDEYQAEIIAGVNLPMVIKFCHARTAGTASEIAIELRDYATEKIVLVSEMLSGASRGKE